MFNKITLEMSLKPFKRTDEDYIRGVAAQVFSDWRALLSGRETVSIMLWCADGSEILDWNGNLDDTFEWCKYLGTANRALLSEDDPPETSLHKKKQLYMENPPEMTYRTLKTIIRILKEEGKKAFPEAEIRVGETFDIGPEFAVSSFKYERHTEICTGSKLDKLGFVDSTACLNADTRKYAAYPDGIPEGLKFGTFLGKQSREFLGEMGFDFLWLSNGLGFSADPWKKTGKIFDGNEYFPEKLKATRDKVFEFWCLFREACPDFPLEVRGTNNSVGIDYATDGVPLWDIYNADLDIVAPPNSPWAALNDNIGLEIMGHMTRTAELPNSVFPFRYYIHDPWWVNSPWYDRYDGAPYDIYLPMAISRIDKHERVQSASSLNLLTIDNSFGNMPAACINEPLPHLLKAEKDAPDAIGPFVWVYPMREYTTTHSAQMLKRMNEGDNFIQDAINLGFPLSCVTSTDSFLCHDTGIYKSSVLVSPIPESAEIEEKLLIASKEGIGVIIYGTSEELLSFKDGENIVKIDTGSDVQSMLEACERFGFTVRHNAESAKKSPVILLHKSDGAIFLDVYSRDTTTRVSLRHPLGAPLPIGCETLLENGTSTFHFARWEHKECRLFTDQKCGVISVREWPNVNGKYRRVIKISGLDSANVRYLPESGYENKIRVVCANANIDNKHAEIADGWHTAYDPKIGYFTEGVNVSGSYYILTEFPDKIK